MLAPQWSVVSPLHMCQPTSWKSPWCRHCGSSLGVDTVEVPLVSTVLVPGMWKVERVSCSQSCFFHSGSKTGEKSWPLFQPLLEAYAWCGSSSSIPGCVWCFRKRKRPFPDALIDFGWSGPSSSCECGQITISVTMLAHCRNSLTHWKNKISGKDYEETELETLLTKWLGKKTVQEHKGQVMIPGIHLALQTMFSWQANWGKWFCSKFGFKVLITM